MSTHVQSLQKEGIHLKAIRAKREWNAVLGMIFFLGSWIMLFGGIFLTYGAVRVRANIWPPLDLPPLPLGLPGLNTALIVASSVALQWGFNAIRQDKTAFLKIGLPLAFVLGVGFLVLQFQVWLELWVAGLQIDTHTYGSVFYALTTFHAAHVVIGLLALAWLSIQAWRNTYTSKNYLSIRLWALYWHFVGIIWAFIFLTVYVL